MNNQFRQNSLKSNTRKLVLVGIFTALVIILQALGAFIKLGSVASVSLVLVPIVVGAAICGPLSGAWLGFVFSIMVLVDPSTLGFFMPISPVGTVLIVILKGTLAGYISGLAYKGLKKVNNVLAVIVSAILCPLVNTGIFFIGAATFFYDGIKATLEAGANTIQYILFTMIGLNFVFELLLNLILAPVMIRLTNLGIKKFDFTKKKK